MKKRASLCAFALLFAGLTAVSAGQPAAKPAVKQAKVTGEVIDSACYIKSGAKGAGHVGCAQACAKAGIPLALLEDGSNKVVWLASKEDATTPNEQLLPFAGKKVTVTGSWAERGGAKLLVVDSVAAAK